MNFHTNFTHVHRKEHSKKLDLELDKFTTQVPSIMSCTSLPRTDCMQNPNHLTTNGSTNSNNNNNGTSNGNGNSNNNNNNGTSNGKISCKSESVHETNSLSPPITPSKGNTASRTGSTFSFPSAMLFSGEF